MEKLIEQNIKYIGHSNGKTYELIKVADWDKNVGLIEMKEWVFAVWCTFEKIEIINEKTNN
jgi:hypothetical protein